MHKLLLITLLFLSACAAPPKNSRLTADDMEAATTAMAEKLKASDFLKDRTPESEPIVVAIDRVQNLTTDIIPEGEQWWMMARVRDRLNVNALRRERNIRFVIPKQHLLEGMEKGNEPRDPAQDGTSRNPTHSMEATLLSATRAAGKSRTDSYLCEYRVTALASSELVWVETFEFKRTALGKAYD